MNTRADFARAFLDAAVVLTEGRILRSSPLEVVAVACLRTWGCTQSEQNEAQEGLLPSHIMHDLGLTLGGTERATDVALSLARALENDRAGRRRLLSQLLALAALDPTESEEKRLSAAVFVRTLGTRDLKPGDLMDEVQASARELRQLFARAQNLQVSP